MEGGQAGPKKQREHLLDRLKGGALGSFLHRPLGRAHVVLCSSFQFRPALGSAVSFPLFLSDLLTEHSAVSEDLRFGGGVGEGQEKKFLPKLTFFFLGCYSGPSPLSSHLPGCARAVGTH